MNLTPRGARRVPVGTPPAPKRPFFPARVMVWTCFTLGLSLLPLIFSLVSIDGPSFQEILNRGDVILAAVVISGVEVGNAYFMRPTGRWRKLGRTTEMSFGTLFAMVSSYMYANTLDVVAHSTEPGQLNAIRPAIAWHSLVVLIFAIVMGVGNAYLAHVQELANLRYEPI